MLEKLFSEQKSARLLLDPYGSSPWFSIELAQAGAAVVICCNNPILEILIQTAALCPSIEELQTILAEISTLKKLDTRFETFIRSLYHSICNSCQSEIEAQGYIWERDNSTNSYRLSTKVYSCPYCGNEGQFPVTIHDQQPLRKLPPRTLLEAQAASRIADRDDRIYPAVVEALQIYPTRPLYAMVTLLNKLDELTLDQRKRQLLNGLLVEVFDQINSLWSFPPKHHRPKQLALPNRFFEINFWVALETSMNRWKHLIQENCFRPILLSEWSRTPQTGEITLFQGRARELLRLMQNQEFSAVVTVLPRPNQAFWTLCALWSGLLLGKEQVTPLKSALIRKRYDWGWYCRALSASFQELSKVLSEHTPFFVFLEEYEANFLAAALLAADHANLLLESLTVRGDQQRAQILWRISPRPTHFAASPTPHQEPLLPQMEARIASALKEHLKATLEPAHLFQLHAVALANAVHTSQSDIHPSTRATSILELIPFQRVSDYPNYFLNFLENTLRSSPHLTPYWVKGKNLESRLWWLSEISFDQFPFSDRVENLVFQFLLEHPEVTLLELDQALCNQLPGIIAPPLALLRECLASYANSDPMTQKWTLRHDELPSQRERDRSEIHQQLIFLGKCLNYEVRDDLPIAWFDENGQPSGLWYIQTHANLASLLNVSKSITTPIFWAIPGSRVNLFLYKLELYPHLQPLIEKQIFLVRFRQIRWMVAQKQIGRHLFENWLTQDPLKYQSPQLPLL